MFGLRTTQRILSFADKCALDDLQGSNELVLCRLVSQKELNLFWPTPTSSWRGQSSTYSGQIPLPLPVLCAGGANPPPALAMPRCPATGSNC